MGDVVRAKRQGRRWWKKRRTRARWKKVVEIIAFAYY
jgi:hypothetical protein